MKDDCEDEVHLRLQSQGCIFQKNPGGMVPCVHADTSAYTHSTETQTHAWMRNSLKSMSREVVTSVYVALFTRLIPRCTQERVNQARGYTRRPEPASSSSRSFPVPLGTGTWLRHAMRPSQRWRPAVYIGTLYTIRVRMTVV